MSSVERPCPELGKGQQSASVCTSSSSLQTDSQPSYTTDSFSAVGHLAPGLQQGSTRQEAISPCKPKLQPESFAAEPAPCPGSNDVAAPSHDSDNVALRVASVWVRDGAHTADPNLPCIASAGSNPPAQMTTRKRPRSSAPLQEAQPSREGTDDKADAPVSTEREGDEQSPRVVRSAKHKALHGNTESLSQQSFQALQVIEQLALPELGRLADEHSIVWCRLKGFPAWPAQVMTAAAAKPRLKPEPKPGRLPIMFFGTIEVAWASPKDVIGWGQGIKDNLWSKNKHKNRQLFDLGFEQVRDFLHPHAVRKSPQHWWCKPPVQHAKPLPQPAPKSTPRAGKPAHKAAPKAASVPPKARSQGAAAERPQAPVTQRGRVTKPPARLASEAAADVASSEDEDMGGTGGAGAANAKEPKQKHRKSAAKPRTTNKMLDASNGVQPEELPSQAAALDTSMGHTNLASGPSALSAAVQPVPNQANQPAPKQRRASVPGKGVNQGVGLGSGFLAKALGQLMDDGHLLEALLDLLAAMPKSGPCVPVQTTLPLPESSAAPQTATSNLGHGSSSMPEAIVGPQAKAESAGAAKLQISGESMPAVKAEEQGGPHDSQPGSESAPENAGQPGDTGCIAQQPGGKPSTALNATMGKAVLPKRLKGGAAVLAKVLNLNMLAPSQIKAGTTALQSGSECGMVHTSSLQVALAGLGLNEHQLRRIVVKLVAQLHQHTAQQQPVTLQGLSSEAQQGLQDLKEALQAASAHCHAPAAAAATQQHPRPTAVLAAQPAALTNVPEQLAASKLKEARDKAPQYTHIDKNVYAKPPYMPARPKRQPKDDIPVCNCHLLRSDGLFGALPARQPTQRQASSTLRKQMLQKAAEQAQASLGPDCQAGTTPTVRITEDAADHAMSGAAVQGVEPLGTMPNGVMPNSGGMYSPRGAASPLSPAAATERVGCGEECLNRLSFIHCDPKLCPCGLQCSNRPFHQLQSPKVEVFLTGDRGWGVKAAEPVAKGSFIVEYAGEVITDNVCEQRMQIAKQTGAPHFYMMELAPGLIIDARTKGNVARLINSSCAPNCESQKWHDAANGEVKVGIFALRDIPVGEELSYDYQFQHYGLAQAAGDYRCMCGAPTCRGTMDSQPERRKDFGKRIEVWWEGDNVYYRGTIFEYSKNTDKHTVYYDDGEKEKVALATTPHRWLDEGASQHSSPRHPTPDSQGRCLPPRLPSPQGKPPAKGKAAAKPALKKQTQSRKRKLDDVHLQPAAAQLQVHHRPAPQPAVMPLPLAAANSVTFTSSPTVHAGVTCTPQPVQAAPLVASASSQPAPAAVAQQLLPVPEVAETSAAAPAQGVEEESTAAEATAGKSDARTTQGPEEAASTAADGSRLDSRAAAPQPDQVVQPDSVMSAVLPITAAAAAAVFDIAEDQLQLKPQADLQALALFETSFNSTTPAAAAGPESLEPDAAETDDAGLATCEASSAMHCEAVQQRSSEVAPFMQQAMPSMYAPLSDADVEMALSMLEPASTRGCLKEPLLHDATAAAMERLQASTGDHGALKAPLSHELRMSENTGQPPCPSESARADVVGSAPAEVHPASLQQPKKPSLSAAPVSMAARTHEAAKRDDTDPALTGQQPEETGGTAAFERSPPCWTSSGVQNQDKHTLSEHHPVQCSSASIFSSAAFKGDGEGTVVMLEGNSLLGLASYSGSDSDSDGC